MLKTQITGAKYLSPQTNQMTNLNIAIPADSKDTKFGTSDILLAKDVVAYLNALDSDISKELTAQTDKINKINESIKQLIDHNLIKIVTELPTTDIDKNCIYLVPNKDGNGNNVFVEYIYVESKNTFEEVGRIQAKVDLSDYYTKKETDNLILIAKNSAINIHNEDNTKSIKLDIDDTEAAGDFGGSTVNASLIDIVNDCTATINAASGFTHVIDELFTSMVNGRGMIMNNGSYYSGMNAFEMFLSYNNDTKIIRISTNKELTEEEEYYGYSPVDMSLNDGDNNIDINAIHGFTHETNNGRISNLSSSELYIRDNEFSADMLTNRIRIDRNGMGAITLEALARENVIYVGNTKFKISRPVDNTEGATITGVKSIIAFANPSATKVWATDGSTVDLATKANASDVLLKKSASGGYYIEENSNELGLGAFAANSGCTASGDLSYAEGGATASGAGSHAEGASNAVGIFSHAEGNSTEANGEFSHAEGNETKAIGACSHALGEGTKAIGAGSHAEGNRTKASGTCSHAEGSLAVASAENAHAEGNRTKASGAGSHAEGGETQASGMFTHAEGCYTKAAGSYSHSEGCNTEASGMFSHAEGISNVVDVNAIHSIGIGDDTINKNAEYIYSKNRTSLTIEEDPKNGYKYLIGVGGYDGISTDNTTYKSVQEVIADLTSRIEQLETKVRALEAANTPA